MYIWCGKLFKILFYVVDTKKKKYTFTQYIEADNLGSKSRSMYYAQKKRGPFLLLFKLIADRSEERDVYLCNTLYIGNIMNITIIIVLKCMYED